MITYLGVCGRIQDEEVKEYLLSDENIRVKVMTLGGTVTSILVKDKYGKEREVTLGYRSVEEYFQGQDYLGASIGRVCNLIENAQFTLNGKLYQLSSNAGMHCSHGGVCGFDKKIWKDRVEDNRLVLRYVSPDGEEGFPGTLYVEGSFCVRKDALEIAYTAYADKDTVVNLTNHLYFNLDGEEGNILDTALLIEADKYTEIDKTLLPTGRILPVYNTPMDFQGEKTIGRDINCAHGQMEIGDGYDFNYCLKGKGIRRIAQATSSHSGIQLQLFSNSKGLQFYTGNGLLHQKGRTCEYGKRSGFCLEPQNFPNAINIENFPSAILKKGERYTLTIIYQFGVKN